MREYRCPDCGHWLLSSNATYGRVTVLCRNRKCPNPRPKVVLLGGPQRRPADAADDCAILVAASG